MSYEILYDKQFIKLPENNFIPIIYAGSNNCIQFDRSNRGRRERSWWRYSWLTPKSLYATEEAMIQRMEEWRQDLINENTERNNKYIADGHPEACDEYKDENFGYFVGWSIGGSTRKTTYGMVKGIVTTGCRKALTVEQLLEMYINVTVASSYYSKELCIEKGLEPFRERPKTTEELMALLEKGNEYLAKGISIDVNIDASERDMKWVRRKFFPKQKKERQLVEVPYYYTVMIGKSDDKVFLVKKTKYGYRYTRYPYLKYATEAEATRRAKTSGGTVALVDEKTSLYTNV